MSQEPVDHATDPRSRADLPNEANGKAEQVWPPAPREQGLSVRRHGDAIVTRSDGVIRVERPGQRNAFRIICGTFAISFLLGVPAQIVTILTLAHAPVQLLPGLFHRLAPRYAIKDFLELPMILYGLAAFFSVSGGFAFELDETSATFSTRSRKQIPFSQLTQVRILRSFGKYHVRLEWRKPTHRAAGVPLFFGWQYLPAATCRTSDEAISFANELAQAARISVRMPK